MTQKARTSLGLETGPVRPSASQPGGKDDGQDLAARLAKALKREGDRESGLNFHERTYWRPIAERVLADAELLDAIVAWRFRQDATRFLLAQLTREEQQKMLGEALEPDTEPRPISDFVTEVAMLLAEEFYDIPECGPSHLVVRMPTELVRLDFAPTDITEEPTS